MTWKCWLFAAVVAGCCWTVDAADDVQRYFRQLRERGLFVVAEHYAWTRLSAPDLNAELRTDLVVELSRTLAEHASYSSVQQRDELWQQALQVLRDELQREPARAPLLQAQAALLAAAQVHDLRWELLVAPEDGPLRDRFLAAAAGALQLLERQVAALEEALKQSRKANGALTPYELRQLLAAIRVEQGEVLRDRAASSQAGDPQRASDLVDAASAFRQSLGGGIDVRVTARSRLGIADCTRLQQDFERALEMCAALAAENPPLPPDLLDAVDACRVRCWLDQQTPLKGAEYLLGLRQARHVLTGELWFVQLETLLRMRDLAEQRGDQTLTEQLQAEGQLALKRVGEQVGGAWARRCQQLWERDRTRQTLGADLDRLIRSARAEYLGGRQASAAREYATAIVAADAADQVELAQELRYTQGSILLETEDFATAATVFEQLAARVPAHERTPSAHLLAAYALGRLYDGQRTQARRLAYTQALETHLTRFADDPTADDARFMLAQLEEQRLQASRALPLYLAISADHARSLAALAGAARCYESLIARLQELGREWQSLQAAAISELTRRSQSWSDQPGDWTADHAEVTIRMARLHLTGRPANYGAASALLDRFAAARGLQLDAAASSAWQRWENEALPLLIVALAGTDRSQEATKLVTAPAVDDPARGLAVVLGLDQLAQQPATTQFVDLTELLVSAVNQLERQRDRLSGEQQTTYDLVRTRAYLITGRTTQGVAVARSLAEKSGQDAKRLREVALLLSSSETQPAQQLALELWERIEGLEQPGTTNWLQARAGVIETLWKTGDTAEASKRLRLTQLLYPNLKEADVRERYQKLTEQVTPRP